MAWVVDTSVVVDLVTGYLSPEQQTDVVGQLLIDHWTTVRSLPTGSTWEEIREQLAGRNAKELALVPQDHPALATDTFRRRPRRARHPPPRHLQQRLRLPVDL